MRASVDFVSTLVLVIPLFRKPKLERLKNVHYVGSRLNLLVSQICAEYTQETAVGTRNLGFCKM